MACNCGKNKTPKNTTKVIKTPKNKGVTPNGSLKRIIRRSAY